MRIRRYRRYLDVGISIYVFLFTALERKRILNIHLMRKLLLFISLFLYYFNAGVICTPSQPNPASTFQTNSIFVLKRIPPASFAALRGKKPRNCLRLPWQWQRARSSHKNGCKIGVGRKRQQDERVCVETTDTVPVA